MVPKSRFTTIALTVKASPGYTLSPLTNIAERLAHCGQPFGSQRQTRIGPEDMGERVSGLNLNIQCSV